jgi:hypothetical protein
MPRVRACTITATSAEEKARFLDDARAIQSVVGWDTLSDAVISAVSCHQTMMKALERVVKADQKYDEMDIPGHVMIPVRAALAMARGTKCTGD